MDVNEMSEYFDVVLQTHATQVDTTQIDPIQFDEYEKSVFITSTQEEFVRSLYNRSGNFEVTEEDRRALDSLVRSVKPAQHSGDDRMHIVGGSKFYDLPEDVMFIVYEQCTVNSDDPCLKDRVFDVYPCTHDEFNRTYRNPFRGPNDHRVLRIDSGENMAEIVSGYDVKDYSIRYVKRPRPVVLVDLTRTGLDIEGRREPQSCELAEQLHRRIVEYAVQKALQSKSINFKSK